MSEKWRHIIQDGHCPDEPVIREYLAGKLTAAQRFEVENHLASCDSCRDFTEGLSMLTDAELTRHEIEIKSYIHDRLSTKSLKKAFLPYKKLAVAASILLVLSVGTLLWFTTHRPSQSNLAYKQEQPKPANEPKDHSSPDAEETTIELAKDSAEEKPATEETIVRPAPVTEEIMVLEIADQEEAPRSAIAGIEVDPIHETRELTVPETIQTTSIANLSNTQAIAPNAKKAIQKVKGQVVDASTGTPLPGAAVTIKGSTTYVQTDMDGHFEIPVEGQTGMLEFSFIGFDNETIAITDTARLKIEMNQNLMALDEVVVVGYGVKRKKMLTGAITQPKEGRSGQPIKQQQSITRPELTGHKIYDQTNLLYYYLQMGEKEKALGFFSNLRELTKEEPMPQSIAKAERLTRENRLKRASKIIHNWLEENTP